MPKYVIIGGVAGGATAATRLRRLDESAEIIILEKGEYISYGGCGLPYYIGGLVDGRDKLTLQNPQGLKNRYNIDVRIRSEALAIDPAAKTVLVKDLAGENEYTESYDKLILAPGGSPFKPPMPGVNSPGVFTLRTIPDGDRIIDFVKENHPKSATIVGAGFIGIELAENFRALSLEVNILQLSDQVLPILDRDMVPMVHAALRAAGVNLYLNNSLEAITLNPEGGLNLKLNTGTLKTDLVVLSVGVRPDSALAKNAGLKVDDRGGIVVDSQMMTSDPDIYAVGDVALITDFVTGLPAMVPLAAPATKQARIAADNICGLPSKYEGSVGTSILKVFDLTVALTGMSEKAAKARGVAYDKIFLLASDHVNYYPGAKPMWLKVLFDTDKGRLLGAQIVGLQGVDRRIDVLAVALRARLAPEEIAALDLAYAPPYGAAKDPVNMVGFMIEDLINNLTKQFHWSEVDDLPKSGEALLVDVRGEDEFSQGHLPGFINVPLKTLRAQLAGWDRAKPVYVNCEGGLRSYIAARILSQNGFTALYLSGGYRLYSQVKGDLK
ncbi:MAG: FAD-dependent oxidoreductase [Deltaproteobacteria bacterium]|jgi:NADPH-dependent 2,4-dienoyl-CoA reductase/sulfur reductase-like enzyme/rhodanese-related sulfurtransferase|nr:FAD-dependent oxidoreductase [Deltaproteobacteria bacterium]